MNQQDEPPYGTTGLLGAQYGKQMDALAKSLAAFSQRTSQQLTAISSSLERVLGPLAKVDWPRVQKQMEDGTTRLANLGWTLPITFTLQHVAKLSQCSHTDAELDQYMFDYFTRENGRFYLSLRSYVAGARHLRDWASLPEQCFDAYDRGHYLIPIPALLLVIEGAVAKSAGRLRTKDTHPKPHAADLRRRAQQGSIESLV